MPNRLSRLMKTIVGRFPVENPHSEQRQQGWIVDLQTVDHSEPFHPLDHMRPQVVIKEKVREDVIPPAMVCSCRVLPLLDDPMKGVLGNLRTPQSFFK